MKKILFFFLLITTLPVILTTFFIQTPTVFANSVLLQENFDDGNANDGIPADWEEIPSTGVWTIQDGKYYATSSGQISHPQSIVGDNSWSDYSTEVSITSVEGVDRHLLVRYDPSRWPASSPGYAIKYRDIDIGHGFTGHIELQKAGIEVASQSASFKSHKGETHRIKVEARGPNIKVYGDEKLFIDYTDNKNPILNGGIGFFVEISGIGIVNTTAYDDLIIQSLTPTPTPTPTPSPIPTPTPTSTPTPTPMPLPALNVPDLKQDDQLWGNQIYDHLNAVIRQFGCALTSASMVLKFHGHNNANPDTLNNWLITQPDGYIRNGLVNWLALSRYTKEHSSGGASILKYVRLAPNDADLINELQKGRPAIIKLSNHFVVAKNQLGTSFGINDPAYSTRTSLADYSNKYFAINSYRPTNTDLSYILLVLDGDNNIKVFDSGDNEITGYSYTENPLVDDVGGSEKSGETLTIFQYPTPAEGEYKIEISGSAGSYELDVYAYDKDGNLDQDQVTSTSPTTLKLNYDHDAGTPLVKGSVISAQSSTTPSSSTAIITWTTDRPTSSQVVYDTLSHSAAGSAPNYDYAHSSSTFDTNPKILSHSITITGLAAGTTYCYRTVSGGSLITVSDERTFRTLSIAGPPEAGGTANLTSAVARPNPVAVIVQKVLGKTTLAPKQKEQEKQEVPEKKVLGKTTSPSFFRKNLGLFIILFSALAGIAYLQIAKPITGKTSKKRKKA